MGNRYLKIYIPLKTFIGRSGYPGPTTHYDIGIQATIVTLTILLLPP